MRPATATLVVLLVATTLCADGPSGEQIYRKRCAWCHGPNGEGTKKYAQPLTGDWGVEELAKVVAGTMPEDDPGSCVGADADAVAVYLHDTFYSRSAHERNHPPRVELSRSTATQHLNALAELVGSFRPSVGKSDEKRGLRGEYFPWHEDVVTGYYSDKDRALDRLDAVIRFDWNKGNPVPEKIKSVGYSARWTGSLTAPRTSDYEFVVRSENGVRLWVNAPSPAPESSGQSADPTPKPLIDARVGAGTPTDHRGAVRLSGGRTYPIRTQFFKGPEKTASLVLNWKPPQGVEEEIPLRQLAPVLRPATFAPATKFAPDDRSLGWERGTAVSKAWTQATFDAAVETASYVADHLNELSGTGVREPDPRGKAKQFCRAFVERAFRRPLTEQQKKAHIDRLFDATEDTATGVKRVVVAALISPQFLYRDSEPSADGFAVAARLSFAMWDSLPDVALQAAAKEMKLSTREEVRA